MTGAVSDPGGGLTRIPRDVHDDYSAAACAVRRELCESAAGRSLPYLAGEPVPLAEARGKIENLVGYAQVPLGIAGPLCVDTTAGLREVLVPMATTEGAMVASYSRGMRLFAEAGGVRARVLKRGLSQHPILVFESARDAVRAGEVVAASVDELERITAGTTSHGRLTSVSTQVIGRRLVLRLLFETGDAIGINMAARAADLCSEAMAERTGALARYVHGQDVEKRANARALVEGRGRSTVAEVKIPRDVLARIVRTTPEALAAIARTYAVGFAQLGTQNWLVQAANGLAAVYLACGQDVAYVTESATGFLDIEVTADGDLHAAATLPSILVGTVGGGSGQGTARECLALLGCEGAGHADTFAEILAATVLAGDLSLLAAFCTHEFVGAHERLGRNRPDAPALPADGVGDQRP